MKFNGIINLFEKINLNNFKRSRSLSFKDKNNKILESRKINKFMNKNSNSNINFVNRKKNKFKSLRNIDINFKKEWEEKQKELNNK